MTIHGIAIEGGGAAGIAHIGALEVLEERRVLQHITHFIGSSAGAITAAGLACRAPIAVLKRKIWESDFNAFCDSDLGVIRNSYRLLTRYGWYRGDELEKWIGDVLDELTGRIDITFEEMYIVFGTFLEITVTDVGRGTIYLNRYTSPDMQVKTAVRRSSMIPIFFQADYDSDSNRYFVDGGLMHNYPLDRLYRHFDKSECIGLKLLSSNELHEMNPGAAENDEPSGPMSLTAYLKIILTMLRNQALKSHVHADDWERTIAIDVGTVSAIDFDLKDSEKAFLINQGRAAAWKHMNK